MRRRWLEGRFAAAVLDQAQKLLAFVDAKLLVDSVRVGVHGAARHVELVLNVGSCVALGETDEDITGTLA